MGNETSSAGADGETAAPKVALLLAEVEEDRIAFMSFSAEHWPQVRSTDPPERVDREIGR